jgi:hypothetical protein
MGIGSERSRFEVRMTGDVPDEQADDARRDLSCRYRSEGARPTDSGPRLPRVLHVTGIVIVLAGFVLGVPLSVLGGLIGSSDSVGQRSGRRDLWAGVRRAAGCARDHHPLCRTDRPQTRGDHKRLRVTPRERPGAIDSQLGSSARLAASTAVTKGEQAKRQKQERQEDHMPSRHHKHDHSDSQPYRK